MLDNGKKSVVAKHHDVTVKLTFTLLVCEFWSETCVVEAYCFDHLIQISSPLCTSGCLCHRRMGLIDVISIKMHFYNSQILPVSVSNINLSEEHECIVCSEVLG